MISATTISPLNKRIVDGVPSFVGLLDTYGGAAAAYSVRRLSSTYEGALMEVRIDTVGQPVYDIGFDANGDLDTADLISKAAGNDAFVRTWYDQSGNSLNQIQSTASNQPKIVSSGVIETEGGKPKLLFDGVDDYYIVLTSASNNFSIFNNSKFTNAPTSNEVLVSLSDSSNVSRYELRADGTDFEYFIRQVSFTTQQIKVQDTNHNLFTSIYLNGNNNSWVNSVNYINNTSTGLANPNYDRFNIGVVVSSGLFFYFDGMHQEIIYYTSDQLSNRLGIESNINSYFSIY